MALYTAQPTTQNPGHQKRIKPLIPAHNVERHGSFTIEEKSQGNKADQPATSKKKVLFALIR
jgi:hypothetical protein